MRCIVTSPFASVFCAGYASTYARGFKPLSTPEAHNLLDTWIAGRTDGVQLTTTDHVEDGWDLMCAGKGVKLKRGKGKKLKRVKLNVYQDLVHFMEARGLVLEPVMPGQRGIRP